MFSGQDERKEKKGAKQTVNTKAGTERRQRQLMSLRHRAHGELMKHLRTDKSEDNVNNVNEGSMEEVTNANNGPVTVWSFNSLTPPNKVPLSMLPEFVTMVQSGQTPEEVYQGVLLIRKILSVEKNPPYDAVVNSGILPKFIELLSHHEFPQLQFEVAWALTNLAAGTTENTVLVASSGAVMPLTQLLHSPNADCRDQACWALGNLAGENAACRDLVIQSGALDAFITLLVAPEELPSVKRNAVWALSNLCRGRPQPNIDLVSPALPILANLLHSQDEQVVIDALWALSYVSDGAAERVQRVVDAGIVPRVVELMHIPSSQLALPAIRTIGNMAAGTDEQTQCVINAGALPAMRNLLSNPKRAIRKETCWTVSNIAAGQQFQIDALISSDIFPAILECMASPELDVKKEAVWGVANVTFCGNSEQMKYLVNINAIPYLCDTLSLYDAKIVTVTLEALQLFLQLAEEEKNAHAMESNLVADQMMSCGGVEAMEKLQTHQSADVYNLVYQILQTYFNAVEDAPVMGEYANFMNEAQNLGGGDGQTNFNF